MIYYSSSKAKEAPLVRTLVLWYRTVNVLIINAKVMVQCEAMLWSQTHLSSYVLLTLWGIICTFPLFSFFSGLLGDCNNLKTLLYLSYCHLVRFANPPAKYIYGVAINVWAPLRRLWTKTVKIKYGKLSLIHLLQWQSRPSGVAQLKCTDIIWMSPIIS